MDYDVKAFEVRRLKPSPKTRVTHADFDAAGRDAWLLADIREKGVLTPILVRTDGTIEDGYRRVECAKRLGIAHVPGYLISDDGEVFSSMQLARNMTLYAKCVLYRDRIRELVERGIALRGNQKNPDSFKSRDQLEGEWVQLEEVLAVHRKTLQVALVTLDEIDTVRATDAAKAERLTTTFRNKGLKPVRRLLGYAVDGQAEDEDVADTASRDYESDEPVPPPVAKLDAQTTTNTSTNVERAEEPPSGVDSADNNVAEEPGPSGDRPWQEQCYAYLTSIENHLQTNGRMTPAVKKAIATIERAIAHGGQAKVA